MKLPSRRSAIKNARKERLFELGWKKPHLTMDTSGYKTHSLRRLHERGFSVDRAIEGANSRIKYHSEELRRVMRGEQKYPPLPEVREMLSHERDILRQLEYLKGKGGDFWYPQVMRIYNRDLAASVRSHPLEPLSVEDQAKALLSLSGIGEKGKPLSKEATRFILEAGKTREDAAHFDGQLAMASTMAKAQVLVTESDIAEARSRRASTGAIKALERYREEGQELVAFLERISFLPEDERYARLRELSDWGPKRPKRK